MERNLINSTKLNEEQTEFLLTLHKFCAGYTNTIQSIEILNTILDKRSYDDIDKAFINRMILWYVKERRYRLKNKEHVYNYKAKSIFEPFD